MSVVKLFLVDDHKMIRDGLKSYFEDDDDFIIVGEAVNGHQALGTLKETEIDILLTDLVMPGMDGMELIKTLKDQQYPCKIIALTMQSEPKHIKKILGYGVDGYLLKTCGETEVRKAIREVSNGDHYYSPEVTGIIMEALSGNSKKWDRVSHEVPLTSREKEVLNLIIKEYTNGEIADELFISVRTVDAHKRNLMEKTGSKNVAGLVLYAIEKELFDDVRS